MNLFSLQTLRHFKNWRGGILLFVSWLLFVLDASHPLAAQNATIPTIDPLYELSATLPNDDETDAVVAGDLNGDGALDLVLSNSYAPNRYYLNDGNGNFDSGTRFGEDLGGYNVKLADMDGDGDLDMMASVMAGFSAQNVIYFNDGFAHFPNQQWLSETTSLSDALIGDVDGDSDFDVIELIDGSVDGSKSLRIQYNNGSAQFTIKTSAISTVNSSGFSLIDLVDLDSDGDLDLVMRRTKPLPGGGYEFPLIFYLNDGAGMFTPLPLPISQPYPNAYLYFAGLGDFDGDGQLDILLTSQQSFNEPITLTLYRNHAPGSDLPSDTPQQLAELNGISDIQIEDIDLDGDLDIVMDGYLFRNQGVDQANKLQFQRYTWRSDGFGGKILLADLNGDGSYEIIVGNRHFDTIYTNHSLPNFDICRPLPQSLTESEPFALLDLAGDKDVDIIYTNYSPEPAAPLLAAINDGIGNFQVGVTTGISVTANPYSYFVPFFVTADLNADGLDDLIVVSVERAAQIYIQSLDGTFRWYTTLVDTALNSTTPDNAALSTTTLAAGDLDGDGDLDLVQGRSILGADFQARSAPNQFYLNQGDGHFDPAQPLGSITENTATSVALADLDNDGNLDIVVGNGNVLAASGPKPDQQSFIYWNRGNWTTAEAEHFFVTPWGNQLGLVRKVVTGDFNGDGLVDLAAWNASGLVVILLNHGDHTFHQQFLVPPNTVPDGFFVRDLDLDGDLDFVTKRDGNNGDVYSLENDGQGAFRWQKALPQIFQPTVPVNSQVVGLSDLNQDGLSDLIAYRQNAPEIAEYGFCLALQTRHDATHLRPPPASIRLFQPGHSALDGPYASPQIFAADTISFTYTLFDPVAHPVKVRGFYSLDGGGKWLPAIPTSATLLDNLPTGSNSQPITYTYGWDVIGSGFFGQSDQVVFRLEVRPDLHPQRNGLPDLSRIPYRAAQSDPFRVRGTQVRVVDGDGKPASDAIVYRLPANDQGEATIFSAAQEGTPFHTNSQGYLSGRGSLVSGDQLVALAPISATHAFTLYYSSAVPTGNGLDMATVSRGGVQTLTVSADHPLILLNPEISLEWDARNDDSFLQDLQAALQRTSATLFDVSEGQVALGDVRLYQNKEHWLSANVVIYASNSIHPRATMGGAVLTPTNDIGLSGIISNAYLPGQVRMGPLWDPFGQNQSELSQDWSQALAHEFSHYFFFLPDNYLGIQNGQLATTDCRGSFMTNTYDASYSEFLTRDSWVGPCLDTVATHLSGRTDWETITRFMPWLHPPTSLATTNAGPATLPLQVTTAQRIDPTTALPLAARNYDLRSASSGELLTVRQARAYLFQTQATAAWEDDTLLALGTTGNGSDRIKVRGAHIGDRLCMLDSLGEQAGCTTIDGLNPHIDLASIPGWQPTIEVSPVSSRTLTIHVTQPLSPGVALAVQLLPAYGSPTATLPISSPWALMLADRADSPLHFTQTLTLPYPAFEGFVRVWLPDVLPAHEAISQFFLSTGWGPNPRGGSGANSQVWGPNPRGGSGANLRAWGANHRSAEAPVASGDGRVTIFDVADILADSGTSSLQAVATLPNLPSWLTPVGQGYRFLSSQPLTRTIAFHYLSREVPPGYEYTLNLYYLPEGGANWQRLATVLDSEEKLAAAQIPLSTGDGQGLYALVATLEMPTLLPGWNQFSYPLPQARTVGEAMASVAGSYQAVYEYLPTTPATWQLYDPAVANEHPAFAELVNDLHQLQLGHVYWINATQAITPYLNVAVEPASPVDRIDLPPATFYGVVNGQTGFVATQGMALSAYRGQVLCGESRLTTQDGEVVYKLQVLSNAERTGCGEAEAVLTLFVDGQQVTEPLIWSNHFAHFQPLHVGAQNKSIYLPIIAR